MKQCAKCDEWKDENAFRPKRRGCRECERIYNQVYNASHAEKRRAYAKQYRESYPGGPQAYDRARYEQNAENRKADAKKWREKNRDWYFAYKRSEKNRASGRAYYHRNKDKAKSYAKYYRRLNKDKVNVRTHRRRARKKGNGGAFTTLEWRLLCQQYGYRCLACGKQEPEIKLTIDHVLPVQLGGTNTIDNLQPLCGECNASKGARHIDYRPDCIALAAVKLVTVDSVGILAEIREVAL